MGWLPDSTTDVSSHPEKDGSDSEDDTDSECSSNYTGVEYRPHLIGLGLGFGRGFGLTFAIIPSRSEGQSG